MTTLNARPAATYLRLCIACGGSGVQVADSYALQTSHPAGGTTVRRWGGTVNAPCPCCLGEGHVVTMTPPAECESKFLN